MNIRQKFLQVVMNALTVRTDTAVDLIAMTDFIGAIAIQDFS